MKSKLQRYVLAAVVAEGLNQKLIEKDTKIVEVENRLNQLELSLQALTHTK